MRRRNTRRTGSVRNANRPGNAALPRPSRSPRAISLHKVLEVVQSLGICGPSLNAGAFVNRVIHHPVLLLPTGSNRFTFPSPFISFFSCKANLSPMRSQVNPRARLAASSPFSFAVF